jgi:hypothetical protein
MLSHAPSENKANQGLSWAKFGKVRQNPQTPRNQEDDSFLTLPQEQILETQLGRLRGRKFPFSARCTASRKK